LRRAREGYFDEWAFRGVPDEIKQDCFTPTGKGHAINPRFREGVTFEHHNLVEPLDRSSAPFLGNFDVIFCRNVMIYFSGEMIRQLVHGLHRNLAEGGWLLVGHAEPNIETFRTFTAVNAPGAVLYRKSTEPLAHQQVFAGSAACAIADNEDCPRVAFAKRKPASVSAVERCAPTLGDLRCMADGGDLHSALRLCDELLEAEPLDVALHQYHALILGQLGRHHEAEQALRRAIYLDRDAALAHYYLGVLRQQRGSHEEAARSFGNTLRALERCRPEQTLHDDDMTASDLERLARARLKDVARTGASDHPPANPRR
jgi:chemotaxis protein methyltransferase CheR